MGIDRILGLTGTVIGLLSLVVGIILSIFTMKKTEAERDKVVSEKDKLSIDGAAALTETTLKLLIPLKQEISELQSSDVKKEAEIASLRVDNAKLKQIICSLIHQLKINNIIPVWDELDCNDLFKV